MEPTGPLSLRERVRVRGDGCLMISISNAKLNKRHSIQLDGRTWWQY